MNAETTDYVTAMGTTVFEAPAMEQGGCYRLDFTAEPDPDAVPETLRDIVFLSAMLPLAFVAFIALWIMLP